MPPQYTSLSQPSSFGGPSNATSAGLLEPGTIPNLYNRPETVAPAGPKGLQQGTVSLPGAPGPADLEQTFGQPKGGTSTTYSTSFNDGPGREVLVPTVVGGKFLTNKEAFERYLKTGEHLGIFDTPEHADAYATKLHLSQEAMGNFFADAVKKAVIHKLIDGAIQGKSRK